MRHIRNNAAIKLVAIKQVIHHPVVDLEVSAQEWRVLMRGILEQFQETMSLQGCCREEPLTCGHLLVEGRTDEIQDQIDAGPLLGDVVLKIGVQPFVAEVQFRSQTDQQTVDVEGCKLELLCKFVQP